MVERELDVNIEVVADPAGSWSVVRASGEVDIQSSPLLDEALRSVLDQGSSSIRVDFGEVTFLDSTGLSVLIGALRRCQSAGGEFRLVSPRPNVRKVLEITGLTAAFHLEESDAGNDVSD